MSRGSQWISLSLMAVRLHETYFVPRWWRQGIPYRACDEREALEQAISESHRLIISDGEMPKMPAKLAESSDSQTGKHFERIPNYSRRRAHVLEE